MIKDYILVYINPNHIILYIIFILYGLLTLMATAFIGLKGRLIKEKKFYDLALGNFGQFIFIPLLLICAVYLISIVLEGRIEEGLILENTIRDINIAI